jgi:hypothetical protein
MKPDKVLLRHKPGEDVKPVKDKEMIRVNCP